MAPTQSMRLRNAEEEPSKPGPALRLAVEPPGRGAPAAPRGCGGVKLLTMNVRGLQDIEHSDSKLREVIRRMERQGVFVVALQETWAWGSETRSVQNPEDPSRVYTLVLHNTAKPENPKGRPRGGVGMILSPEAAKVWDGKPLYYGSHGRLLALRLLLARPMVVGSGYAPTRPGYPPPIREAFLDANRGRPTTLPALTA